jgi:hypothetical protein
MKGINVSPELQALLGTDEYRTEFHLSVDTLPHYELSNEEGNLKAWQEDGSPQLLLVGGHVEHKGHTIVFFENINYGSGLHAVAVFKGNAADVTPEASPAICFRCTGRGVPCEIALPEDGDIPSMVMVPAHGDGCIVPHWYAYIAGGHA